MKVLKELVRMINRISTAGGCISVCALTFFVVLNSIEIGMRTCINKSLVVTDECSGWLLVWMAFTGMGWTLKEDGHIQIDVITRRLSEKTKQFLSVAFAAVGFVVMSVFSFYTILFLMETYIRKVEGVSVIKFPLWYPILGMGLGGLILALQFFGVFVKNILAVQRVR